MTLYKNPIKYLLKIVLCLTLFPAITLASKLSGSVKIDGSSTVFPITEAVAEEFQIKNPRVRVTVGVSGTGGGFKKFLTGEIHINDASRGIKSKELKLAKKNKVSYLEIPVAYDGLTVVINKKNTWVKSLDVATLHKIWKPKSKVKLWSDINPKWPKKKILLYGPGSDSGTFDYFTKVINGKEQASRADYTKSEDDNVLVTGVAGDVGALGYFGYAYYAENKNKLNAVPIVNKKGEKVLPSIKSINNGSYNPLSRPLFIYVSKIATKQPQVKSFIEFYLSETETLAKEVGYVPMSKKDYKAQAKTFELFAK